MTPAEVDLEPEFRALWERERGELDHLGAEVFVPVHVKDDLVGVLAVGPKSSRAPYGADDKSALTALANQTAVAVENARLYATEQRRLRELLILLDIARAVGSTLDLTQVLKLVAQRTAEACEVHRCSLLLLDEQRQHLLPLMSQFASGETDPELWEQYKYTYVQSIDQVPVLKRVFEDRQPLVLDADAIERLPDIWVRPFNIRSLAIIPLIARGRVIGAMALDHVEPGQRFEQEQINLAMTIGSHTAAAIENASLYQQTAEEKARTETVLRETFGGMVLVNQDLRIVSINPGAELISGYSAQQVAGMPVGQVLGKEIEAPGSPLARARETGERVPPVGTMISARQGTRDVLLGVTPLAGSGAVPVQYLLSFVDISKLKEIDRLKSNIVANVSHELRTPLSSIKAYAELLLLGADKGNVQMRQEWLSVIDREADRLTSFVDNLLDLSRLESERVELTREPLHLGELVADELVALRVQAKQRDIGIELDVQPGLPPLVAEEGLIRSVVRNLIGNAIKF
ncbi:MAG: GAF domain-containing protein, partial [Anaerolineales bacterium]